VLPLIKSDIDLIRVWTKLTLLERRAVFALAALHEERGYVDVDGNA